MAVLLKAKARDIKEKPRKLRRDGFIPATVYGPEIEPHNLMLDAKEFSRVPFAEYTHLIELEEEGKDKYDVLIKNIQRNYVSREALNIEFYKIKKGHKVNTKVRIKFIGDSEAVRMGADLVIIHKEVHVRCVPRMIPRDLEVDLTALKEVEDHVTFGDLKIAEEVELLDPVTEVICKAELKKKDHTQVLDEEAAAAEAAAAEAGGAEAPAAEGAEGDKPAENGNGEAKAA